MLPKLLLVSDCLFCPDCVERWMLFSIQSHAKHQSTKVGQMCCSGLFAPSHIVHYHAYYDYYHYYYYYYEAYY